MLQIYFYKANKTQKKAKEKEIWIKQLKFGVKNNSKALKSLGI